MNCGGVAARTRRAASTASSAPRASPAATASSAPNEQLGVGDAEHGEHVVERDRLARSR